MISRNYIRCSGCGKIVAVRAGVGRGKHQRIFVHCPLCFTPIHGLLATDSEALVSVSFEGHEIVVDVPFGQEDLVVTTHPDFPCDPNTSNSPFLDAVAVFGEHTEQVFSGMAEFHHLAEEWPIIDRAYRFYLSNRWDLFDRTLTPILAENGLLWSSYDQNPIQRHDIIHRLLSVAFLPLGPGGEYVHAKAEIWRVAGKDAERFGRYFARTENASKLVSVQQRIFNQLTALMRSRPAWAPAISLVYMEHLGSSIPPSWRIPANDFQLLRDAYRENFELCCSALELIVAAQNIADGRSAETIYDSSCAAGWKPTYSQPDKLPRTIAQFRRKSSEIKELYLDRFPSTHSAWQAVFDRNLRNSIAHADTEYDVESGDVITSKGRYSYLEFVKVGVKQIQLLLLFLDFAKLCRIFALPASHRRK